MQAGQTLTNPYRPGAGHQPPYLAGRIAERTEFERLLRQDIILENLILTGLRGVGKTVLLESFRPIALNAGWFWAGSDLSETASLTEERMVMRILTDLSVVTSQAVSIETLRRDHPFGSWESDTATLDYDVLLDWYESTPGLPTDKLRYVLEQAWDAMKRSKKKGVVFAYDEAQNLADHSSQRQFPTSLLLDVFQSVQRKGVPFMLVLTGLPTLFPKLIESRTFSERMFRVLSLDRLTRQASEDAILKPLDQWEGGICFDSGSVEKICEDSAGYPYFIQFICREAFDVVLQQYTSGEPLSVPRTAIIRKLDSDFFAGRWSRATDRQRALLWCISCLDNCDSEFTVQDTVQMSKRELERPFSSSHVNQMLSTLQENGLIYKNRHGRYAFAVPLLGRFIQRQGKPQQ